MISKERIYHLIEPRYEPGRIVDIGLITLIFLNIVALILETVEPIYNYNRAAFFHALIGFHARRNFIFVVNFHHLDGMTADAALAVHQLDVVMVTGT